MANYQVSKCTELKCYHQAVSPMLMNFFLYQMWTLITFHTINKISPFWTNSTIASIYVYKCKGSKLFLTVKMSKSSMMM